MPGATLDLLSFLSASPTPFHCVAEVRRRLERDGFQPLDERRPWAVAPGGAYLVERGGGSVVAWRMGARPPAEAGFRVVGAHTDSPGLRLKPRPGRHNDGWLRADVEVYGGATLPTWVDRDLSIAGRLVVERDGGALDDVLVDLVRPVARIPALAIHLDRQVNEDGLKLDKHRDLGPALALRAGAPGAAGGGGDADLAVLAAVAEAAGVDPAAVRGHDLCLYDVQPPVVAGLAGEFVLGARLDNQASCHAAIRALLATGPGSQAAAAGGARAAADPGATAVVALFDHEEVGSGSARGAAGSLLRDVLARVAGDGEALRRAVAGSWLVSVDMAHAVHPSRGDRHDGEHLPRLNGGPVIKTHAGQRYATDARTGAMFRRLCKEADVPFQEFVVRQDILCGSTIGPISAAGLGMATVDVGSAMLSMHSVREMAGAQDPALMERALSAFLGGAC